MLNLIEEYLFHVYKVHKEIHSSVDNLLHRTNRTRLEKIIFYTLILITKGNLSKSKSYNTSAMKLILS